MIQKIQIHHSNLHFSMVVNLLFFGYAQHLQALKTFKDFEVLVLFRSFQYVEPTIWSQADTPLRHVVLPLV
jgi:hypothetical protein